jgi:hypothetical protein
LILNSKFTFKVNLEIISETLNKLAKRFNRYMRIIFKNNSISPKLDVIVIASRIAIASPSIIDIYYIATVHQVYAMTNSPLLLWIQQLVDIALISSNNIALTLLFNQSVDEPTSLGCLYTAEFLLRLF